MVDKEIRLPISNDPFGIFNIELTNRCPMSCVMCPRTNNMTREQGDMNFDLFKRIINELVNENKDYINHQPVWLHHFGESLLHREFDTFIRYAVQKEIVTCLSVNPLMLTEPVSRALLESKPDILYISLDGHDNESFEKIRGVKKAYQRSLDNLNGFLRLKQELQSNCRTVLSMIDFGLNRESIDQTRSYWESQPGVDEFLMKSFSTWDGSAGDINQLEDKSKEGSATRSNWVECNFPWERMTILWDGEVVPCCNDYNELPRRKRTGYPEKRGNAPRGGVLNPMLRNKKLSLGNVNDRSLSEIWNGPQMKQLREEFINNHVVNPLCCHCEKLRLPRDQWDW